MAPGIGYLSAAFFGSIATRHLSPEVSSALQSFFIMFLFSGIHNKTVKFCWSLSTIEASLLGLGRNFVRSPSSSFENKKKFLLVERKTKNCAIKVSFFNRQSNILEKKSLQSIIGKCNMSVSPKFCLQTLWWFICITIFISSLMFIPSRPFGYDQV